MLLFFYVFFKLKIQKRIFFLVSLWRRICFALFSKKSREKLFFRFGGKQGVVGEEIGQEKHSL